MSSGAFVFIIAYCVFSLNKSSTFFRWMSLIFPALRLILTLPRKHNQRLNFKISSRYSGRQKSNSLSWLNQNQLIVYRIGAFLRKIPCDRRVNNTSSPIDEEETLNNTVRFANKTVQWKTKLAWSSMQFDTND